MFTAIVPTSIRSPKGKQVRIRRQFRPAVDWHVDGFQLIPNSTRIQIIMGLKLHVKSSAE